MPAMTNPEGYIHELYDPTKPTKRGIMGHSEGEEKECSTAEDGETQVDNLDGQEQ